MFTCASSKPDRMRRGCRAATETAVARTPTAAAASLPTIRYERADGTRTKTRRQSKFATRKGNYIKKMQPNTTGEVGTNVWKKQLQREKKHGKMEQVNRGGYPCLPPGYGSTCAKNVPPPETKSGDSPTKQNRQTYISFRVYHTFTPNIYKQKHSR